MLMMMPPFFLVPLLPVGEADWHSRAVAWLVMCDWSLCARSAAKVCGICGNRCLWHESVVICVPVGERMWLEGGQEEGGFCGHL